MSVVLYKHNQETYDRMIKMFKTENRVGVVQPTGTGKSYLILKWIEDHIDEDIILLTSSHEIISQLHTDAKKCNLDISRVYTNIYQTFNLLDDEYIKTLNPDKIILDEFHRGGAEQWGKTIEILLNNNKDSKVLGLTATHIRYLDDERNMADELFYNNLATYMTLGEAIFRQILPKPEIINVWYDFDNIFDTYERDITSESDKKKIQAARRNLEESYGIENIFSKYMKFNGKYIVFCRPNVSMKEMVNLVTDWVRSINTSINSYITLAKYGNKKDIQVKKFIKDDDNKSIRLLFCINRLNEGIHVPGIDGVIMLRPTDSPTVYLQQLGRGLSSDIEDIPFIFDFVNNCENISKKLGCKNILNEEIRQYTRSKGISDVEYDSFRVIEKNKSYVQILEDLEDYLYPDNDDIWEYKFNILAKFINKFGYIPKSNEIYNGINIGRWLAHRKTEYNNNILSDERVKKLEALGIELKILSYEEKWDNNFNLLELYIEEFNKLPTSDEIYHGVNIGIWVKNNRRKYSLNKLSDERKTKLESLGIIVENFSDVSWDNNLKLLEEYIKEFNKLPGTTEIYRSKNIGSWFKEQRYAFYDNELSEERKNKLKSLGIIFNEKLSDEEIWDNNLKLLEEYIKEFNKLPRTDEIYHGKNIGQWFRYQRRLYDDGKLSDQKCKKLISIGADLRSIYDKKWDSNLKLLEDFIKEFGDLPKTSRMYHGKNIGQFLYFQKKLYNKGTLPEKRYKQLNSLGIYFIDDKVIFKKKDKE